MPTDTATRSVTINASRAKVLTTIRAVETQPAWVKEIRAAEVLERNADGTPAKARFTASTPVGSDHYTLAYEHSAHGMSWHLVDGRLQTGQDANYELHPLDRQHTDVTFRLSVSHNLPLPGFVRTRVINGLAASTVDGLKRYIETGT